MTFYAFGVNHLRAPLGVRELFALEGENIRRVYRHLNLEPNSELVLLSTCNRTEAYLCGSRQDVEQVQSLFAEAVGLRWPEEHAFLLQDEAAVRHVLEVAAGLKSMVLGDAQIFAQLKEAYRIAEQEQCVGTTMHRLMHTAFRTAKRVINETDLNTGAASVPYQAVEVARRYFESRAGSSLRNVRALVVGAGSMGRLAGEALQSAGVEEISFTNRSDERAREVAARYRGAFVAWDERHRACAKHDLVLVATSADHPVIRAEELRSHRPQGVLFFDISVPRNVEAGVERIDGLTVVDIDELSQILEQTEDLRKTSVPAAQAIVDETMSEFVSWVFHHQALQPAIQAIGSTFERIRQQEVDRHHTRLSQLDREELDRITRSIVQKILAIPIVRLKSVDPESIDFTQGVRLLHALFRVEKCEGEPRQAEAPDSLASEDDSLAELHEVLRRFVAEEAPDFD